VYVFNNHPPLNNITHHARVFFRPNFYLCISFANIATKNNFASSYAHALLEKTQKKQRARRIENLSEGER